MSFLLFLFHESRARPQIFGFSRISRTLVFLLTCILPHNGWCQQGQDMMNRMVKEELQGRLLEFASPQARSELVSQQIISALIATTPASDTDQEMRQRAIRLGVSLIDSDVSKKRQESLMQMQLQHRLGMDVPGLKSSESVASMEAKIESLRVKRSVRQERFLDDVSYTLFSSAKRQLARETALQAVTFADSRPTIVRSGGLLNTLFDSINRAMLLLKTNENIAHELDYLTIDENDFAKIRLQLDVEGEPLIFTASEGVSNLGRPPTCLMNPSLVPYVEKIQEILMELSKTDSGTELYKKTIDFSKAIDDLDAASDRVIGTAKSCAQQGVQSHRMWKASKAYRARLRGILEQLEIGDSAEVLENNRYDPKIRGCNLLTFVRFVHDSGCRFAPARNGDEAAYVRLMDKMLQLQSLLEQNGYIKTRFLTESRADEIAQQNPIEN